VKKKPLSSLAFPLALGLALCPGTAVAQDNPNASNPAEKARVFVTDSQSWSIGSQGGGGGGVFASRTAGGARPQTAEIIKTFGERCPQVMVNNIQGKADYIVLLDHEGGKSAFSHKNKVAVFARVSGDTVVSKSTLSLGGSVQDACEAIKRDWAEHGGAIRQAAVAAAAPPAPAAPAAAPASLAAPAPASPAAPPSQAVDPPPDAAAIAGKLAIASEPEGADIEVDGSFVGNTPSDLQLPEGVHNVVVRKTGFKGWERNLKVTGGSNVHIKAELEKSANP
jgi:hypothetical protein